MGFIWLTRDFKNVEARSFKNHNNQEAKNLLKSRVVCFYKNCTSSCSLFSH